MKKLIALLLALVLLCSLAGCGKQSTRRSDDDSSSSTAQAEPPRAPGVSDPVEDEPNDSGANNTGGANDAGQPVDFLGSWNGNVYSNEFLELSYTLPDGWIYASDEELLEMVDIAANNELLSDRSRLSLELSKSLMVYGMFAQDPVGGSSVQVMFMNLEGYAEISEEECARQMAAQQEGLLDESSGVTLSIGDEYRAPLGGKDFLVMPMEMNVSGIAVEERIYIQISGEHGMMVAITALADQDIDTMEGGVPAFAPLGGVSSGSSGTSGGTGTSGVLTATGDIGYTFSTMFFDYTLLSAESPAEYDGYTAQSGNKLILVRVRVENDFGSTLPMYDTDFPLFWGDGNNGEYSWAVDAFNDDMMPLEWELPDGKTAEYDMLFEVPADKMEFALSYLEEYTDRNGNDQTGDWYDAYFTLLASASA